MFIIKDGTGRGYAAEVDVNNRLHTKAVTLQELRVISDADQQAYMISTDLLTVPASEANVFWFKFTGANQRIHIEKFWFNWNGGDTNHNRVVIARFWAGMAEPSANNEVLTPGNLYFGSVNSPSLSAQGWDGVSTGMTIASQGGQMGTALLAQGQTVMEHGGAVVLPKDQIFGLSVQAEEIGKFAFALTFWVNEEGD
jgi:hypothetical protein